MTPAAPDDLHVNRLITLEKSTLATGVALVVSVCLGPIVIRLLRSRFRERIASDSAKLNELHSGKKNTPTMGGLLIMAAFLTGSGFTASRSTYWPLFVALTAILLCATGAIDDWIKLRTSRKGLTPRQKLAAQTLIAGMASLVLFLQQLNSGDPVSVCSAAGWLPESLRWLMVPWGVFVIVACSNAVNLTDGLDGLAAGSVSICGFALTLISTLILGNRLPGIAADSTILLASLSGAALGFLYFNRHPAGIFMGDAGSLPVGGLLGLLALGCRLELLLIPAGIVFLVETVSVIVQVGWYRKTGRRILLCSPLHNHFVFQKVPETRIVRGFWILALVGAIIASATAAIATDALGMTASRMTAYGTTNSTTVCDI